MFMPVVKRKYNLTLTGLWVFARIIWQEIWLESFYKSFDFLHFYNVAVLKNGNNLLKCFYVIKITLITSYDCKGYEWCILSWWNVDWVLRCIELYCNTKLFFNLIHSMLEDLQLMFICKTICKVIHSSKYIWYRSVPIA